MTTHRHPHPRRSLRTAAPAALAAGALLAALTGGCTRPLLSSTDERTPFDRYDALRNQYARQYVEDEYGALKPNLRGRLAPR